MQRTGNDAPYDGERDYAAYYMAMFRRACMQGDARARVWMERHFRPTILGWLHRSPALEVVLASHPEEYYVGATFERLCSLAKQISPQEDELQSLLRYMQACLNAIIGDVLREARASSLRIVGQVGNWQKDSDALWKQLQQLLPDPREQRLAYLLYVCDLKPASIVRLFPQEFSNLEEISHLRCALLDRLQQVIY